MTKKRSEEDTSKMLLDMGYKYISTYFTTTKRVIFTDKFGYKYDGSFLNLIRGAIPRFVGKENRFTLSNIKLWLKINKKKFSLCKNNVYNGNHKKLYFQCKSKKCLEVFQMCWDNVASQNQGCPYCAGRRVGKHNNLEYLRPDLAEEWDYNKNKISPKEVTCGSNKKVWWICRKCKREWCTEIFSRVRGRGCRNCSQKKIDSALRMSNDEFSENFYNSVDEEYSLLSEYVGMNKKIKVIHNICGYVWDVQAGAFLNAGTRCPSCKFTKGERAINLWLIKNGFYFQPQKKFADCKLKKELPFDFYLPELNLCIEYDGILHFEDKFNSPEQFKLTKKRDNIKTKYCKENNIKLIRIPYWNLKKIEKILEKNLLF